MALNKRNQNKRSNILVITEAVLTAYMGYISHFILTQIGISKDVPVEQLVINVGMLTVSILLCSLSVGLYEAKLRETFRGIMRRIFVSAGLSYFLVEVLSRAFFDGIHIDNYLIEIGGEIRAKGTKENGKPWIVKLVNPVKANDNNGFKVIDLTNKSMATSGNYRKYRVAEDGKKYVHTINPKTGFATESNLLSASVIANLDCADVDAYATAFMAMGLEKTKEFLKIHPNIKVILIYTSVDGSLTEFSTY